MKMADAEVTKELPPGEPRKLDIERFQALIADALSASEETVAELQPSVPKAIYRVRDDRVRREIVRVPHLYRHAEMAAALTTVPEVKALSDFLWERGAFKRRFRGPEPGPARSTWEWNVLWELVGEPLSRLREQAAIREAIESDADAITDIELSPEAIEFAADELTRRTQGRHRLRAHVPVGYFKWEITDASLQLDGNTLLRKVAPKEAYHLLSSMTTFERVDSETRSMLMATSPNVLELVVEFPESRKERSPDRVEEVLPPLVDAAKLALAVAHGRQSPPQESTIYYRDILGGTWGVSGNNSFRRRGYSYSHGGVVYTVTSESAARTVEIYQQVRIWSKKSDDVARAIWHYGRAALQPQARDRLLESVIGLEGLLIPYAGESTYRFSLHGAALMATTPADATSLSKELKDLYRKRSGFAHGSSDKKAAKAASRAIELLAQAVGVVVNLLGDGTLNAEEKIAKQVEEAVLSSANIGPPRVVDSGDDPKEMPRA